MIDRDSKCLFVTNYPGEASIISRWLDDTGTPLGVMNRASLGPAETSMLTAVRAELNHFGAWIAVVRLRGSARVTGEDFATSSKGSQCRLYDQGTSGKRNATNASPAFVSSLPAPPAAMTTYWRPYT